MANHRATGRPQIRPLASSARASHRDSAAVSAGIVKVGVLGALATATIAVPIASATAETQTAGALPAPAAAPAAPVAAPAARVAPAAIALPMAQAGPEGAAATDAAAAAELSVAAPKPVDPADPEAVVAGEVSAEGYMRPTDAPSTSSYGWRIHPTLGYRKMHDGVDFGAACNTPARAAKGGTVVAVEYNSSSGNRVIIDHGDGVRTGYFHLSAFKVKVGQQVEQGQTVGLVGSTGRSTGCHLHFSKLDSSGTYSDPMSLFR
ncbi:M23 family metallopeptidase [Brachybacterium huguangmaarense]